ncbi:MAG: WYL domain-containing protein, partial [Bacteroidales bacterium]|nr:WYL domain-containing protein [Bacteroidales bacterium]
DDTLDVKLQVKINYELKRLLLSYADSITILAPQRLVEEHKESLRRAMENANHC